MTVEEIVDAFPSSSNSVILASWSVGALVTTPGGARPSNAHGHYTRDNAFYVAWEATFIPSGYSAPIRTSWTYRKYGLF